MAKLLGKGKIEFEFTLTLTEEEFNALTLLANYEPTTVTRVLGENVSMVFDKTAKNGIVSFLDGVKDAGQTIKTRVANARSAFGQIEKPL